MTNKCDLDEMKHIAQQKFIELANSPVQWERPLLGWDCAQFGGWRVLWDRSVITGHRTLGVCLKGQWIWSDQHPTKRIPKKTKAGKPNKQDAAKAEKEYLEAQIAYNADPMVVAVYKVRGALTAIEEEKRCQEMEEALKTSCKALQEALKNTATTPAPQVQTGRIEPYSVILGHSETYPTQRRHWWQFWRGL